MSAYLIAGGVIIMGLAVACPFIAYGLLDTPPLDQQERDKRDWAVACLAVFSALGFCIAGPLLIAVGVALS